MAGTLSFQGFLAACVLVNRAGSVPASDQMQLLAKSRALPSGVLNLAVEEWKGCARGQQMKNSSLLCFLSGVCRGTCWQLLVWQHSLSPQLLPRGCGTWQGLQAGAASSGALQASCRSVLPQQVGRRCLQTFTQPSAWCRLDGHCIPWASSVARQVPAKDPSGPAPHRGASDVCWQGAWCRLVLFTSSITPAGCRAYWVPLPNNLYHS